MLSEISSVYPIIFTIIWQSSLFITAGLIASYLCKHHPAKAHQMLFLSMIAALAVPFITIVVKHLDLGIFLAESEPAVLAISEPAVENIATSEVSVQPYRNPLPDVLPSVSVEPEKLGLTWSKILIVCWVEASVIFMARLFLTFILGIRVVRKAQPFEYSKISESIKSAASKLGIKKNIAIFSNKSVPSPVIWCWKRRPILLLPSDKRLLDDKIDLVGILCHELAHLKRRDHIAGLLSEFMVVFLPWHPLLWWARKRLLNLSEHACDDWVIAAGGCGTNYAESLLDLVPAKQMAFLPAVVRNRNVLKGRVLRILQERYSNPRLSKKWILSAVIITTCITLTVAFAQTRSGVPEEDLVKDREGMAVERATPAGNIPDLLEMEKRRLENPDIMIVERLMHEKMILVNYGALFERFGLPDDKMQDFKTLLVDYRMKKQEWPLVMTDPSLSEEEIKEKLELVEDQEEAIFEKQAMGLLGMENYKIYEAYRDRLWEHQLVTQFINLPGADEGFSDEKEQELIDALYEVRHGMETEYGLNSYDGMQFFIGVNMLSTDEERARRLEIYDCYIESAWGILPESKAEQFETIIRGMQEIMTEAEERMLMERPPSLPGGGDEDPQ